MSDPTGAVPAEGTAAPESAAPSAPEPQPWAPVLDRMDELANNLGNFDQRFEQLEQRLPAPEQPAEPDPWAALMGGEPEEPTYYDQFGNPVELPGQQPGLDLNALQQAIGAQINQAVTPYQQQLQEIQTQRAHDQLVQRIPQLADTPENAEVRQQTAQRVQAAIQNYPAPVQQALMNDPGFIETIFKAAEAEKLAQGQAPASGQVPSLEAAGGAVPGGDGSQPNYIQSAHQGAWGGLPPGLR